MKPNKVEFECQNCGCKAVVESVKEDLTVIHFCFKCGKKVK